MFDFSLGKYIKKQRREKRAAAFIPTIA